MKYKKRWCKKCEKETKFKSFNALNDKCVECGTKKRKSPKKGEDKPKVGRPANIIDPNSKVNPEPSHSGRAIERYDAPFDWTKAEEEIRNTPPNYANPKLKLIGYHSWWNTDRFVWSPVYADKVTGETRGVNLEKFKIPIFKSHWRDADNPPLFEDRAPNTWPHAWPPGECPSREEYEKLNREAYLKRKGQGLPGKKI